VAHWEQYEVWRLNGTRWEPIGWFPDLALANAVARGRQSAVRVIHVQYEGGREVSREVLAEIGAMRQQP